MTSTINCTAPEEPLNTRIFPAAPNGTTIVLAMVCPAWKFTFEVASRAAPPCHAVRYPAGCGSTAAIVAMTAATPPDGIPAH